MTNEQTSEQPSYPLFWPVGWKRTARPEGSRFSKVSMDHASRSVINELARMGVRDFNVEISTNVQLRRDGLPMSNQRQPQDTGAAVYFKLKEKPCVLACDRWNRVECNLWAIAKHIDAQRGRIRWGVGTLDQAFAGYAALPPPSGSRDWWAVLGVSRESSMDVIKTAYRDLARVFHPDSGGTSNQMAELNGALATAKFEKGER
jgi:hypothetical protein